MKDRRHKRASERLSVMLIPTSKGAPLSFQTTKRRLLVWLLLSFGSMVFVTVWTIRTIVEACIPDPPVIEVTAPTVNFRELYQQAMIDNEELRAATDAMAAEFAQTVDRHRDQLRLFSELSSLPLEEESNLDSEPVMDGDLTTEEDAASPDDVGDGRGGPTPGLLRALSFDLPELSEAEECIEAMVLMTRDLRRINTRLEGRNELLRCTPLLCPLRDTWRATDGFGWRRHPISGERDMHEGLDMAAAYGTPVVAPADGIVRFSGRRAGYGRLVIIDHGTGLNLGAEGEPHETSFSTRYGHLSRALVEEGDHVTRGQEIGRIGSTGISTGSHLHYEIRVAGEPTDPLEFMMEH